MKTMKNLVVLSDETGVIVTIIGYDSMDELQDKTRDCISECLGMSEEEFLVFRPYNILGGFSLGSLDEQTIEVDLGGITFRFYLTPSDIV